MRELAKLEIVYEDAPGKPVALVPTTKRDDPLTLTQFGSYVLKPPVDRQPIKYTASIRKLGARTFTQVTDDWPRSDNFYLIRLNGFRGDRKALTDTIKDPKKVPNALDSFEIKTDVTLAMGEAKSSEDLLEEVELDGNKLYVKTPMLKRGNARRAYMLFPLTEKQFEEQLPVLRKLGEEGLPDHIRKSLIGPQDMATITAKSEPAWYELPLVAGPEAGGRLKAGCFGRVPVARHVRPQQGGKARGIQGPSGKVPAGVSDRGVRV